MATTKCVVMPNYVNGLPHTVTAGDGTLMAAATLAGAHELAKRWDAHEALVRIADALTAWDGGGDAEDHWIDLQAEAVAALELLED